MEGEGGRWEGGDGRAERGGGRRELGILMKRKRCKVNFTNRTPHETWPLKSKSYLEMKSIKVGIKH